MAITNVDQLVNGLANSNSRNVIDKASIGSVVAGNLVSLWRSAGTPGQGAIPTTPAVCDNNLLGGVPFTQQVSPSKTYIAYLTGSSTNSTQTFEIRDRLAHMGGLSGIVTTAQTVGIDLGPTGLNVSSERYGSPDYSDVQWFFEWYAATGGTATVATVNVTYDDASTGNISVTIAATRPASFMLPIISAVPGRSIRAVNTVTLSVTTGTAGNFGVNATRLRATQLFTLANFASTSDWAGLGLPDVANGACLMFMMQTSTTSTGIIRGSIKFAHG